MRLLITVLAILALSTTTRGAGLLIPEGGTAPPLRITSHTVNTTISDRIAITELTQVFRNDSNQRLEGTYIFPLPQQADLTDFQLSFNGTMHRGEVLPAEEAREIYEAIVRQLRDPGLIEFIGSRLLRMRIFPIEPNSDTRITLRYQQICRPVGGMMGYHYPLRTREASGYVDGTVRFNVTLHTTEALKNVWSPTHAVEIVRDGEHVAKAAYEASSGSLDEDFLLLYGTDQSDLGLSVVAHRPDDADPGHFVLMLSPKQMWPEDTYEPQDIVFVLDTSGSMAGSKIDQARQALRYCINSLDDRDRFNVVRFSTGFDTLDPAMLSADRATRDKAIAWIDRFTAAGGTNIGDTLDHVVRLAQRVADTDAGRPFVVVFLTDGMGNRDAETVMSMLDSAARTGDATIRLFPFGVGHDVNTVLLDRLSARFTGRPTYVHPGENLELALGDFFSIISRPVLTNLELSLPNAGITEQFPPNLGDLYAGQQLVIAGRFSQSVTDRVTLRAMRNGTPVEYNWPGIAFANNAEASSVPSVWAGRKIAYLIDQIRQHGETPEMVTEVCNLAMCHGIQTPYTSWLVDPERQREVILGQRLLRERGRAVTRRGGGFGGGGVAGGGGALGDPNDAPARFDAQRDRVRSLTGTLADDSDWASDGLYALALDAAMEDQSGELATLIAASNESLRQSKTRDTARLDASRLLQRTFNSRVYNRIGVFLIDESIDDQTAITVVRFASDAYFDLVLNRADLREVLASQPGIATVVAPGQALLIAENTGIETFSQDQRQQFGLVTRSSDD